MEAVKEMQIDLSLKKNVAKNVLLPRLLMSAVSHQSLGPVGEVSIDGSIVHKLVSAYHLSMEVVKAMIIGSKPRKLVKLDALNLPLKFALCPK